MNIKNGYQAAFDFGGLEMEQKSYICYKTQNVFLHFTDFLIFFSL